MSIKGIIQETTITDISLFLYTGQLILQIAFKPNNDVPRTVHCFNLNRPIEVQKVIKLLQYTQTENILDLQDKKIITVYKDHFTYGFSDLDGKIFVPLLTNELMEVNVETILNM